MITDNLTEDTFLLYAIKSYQNHGCISKKEFQEDLARIKYIKRLMRRYQRNGDIDSLRIRLILNHIIILFNVLGANATRILFFKLEKPLWKYLKPFLVFLDFLSDKVEGIDGKTIVSDSIKMDKAIIEELRKI